MDGYTAGLSQLNIGQNSLDPLSADTPRSTGVRSRSSVVERWINSQEGEDLDSISYRSRSSIEVRPALIQYDDISSTSLPTVPPRTHLREVETIQPIRHPAVHLNRPPRPLRQTPQRLTSSVQVIQVHRVTLQNDLIHEFVAPDILNVNLRMKIKGEVAEDDMGVSREVYTAFWEGFLETADGNSERVPQTRSDYGQDEWGAIGRILLKGYKDHNIFPLHLAKAFVVGLIFGEEAVTENILLESYKHYLPETEWEILDRAQKYALNGEEQEELLSILTDIGSTSIPDKPGKMKEVLLQLAHLKLIQDPKYPLDMMAETARDGLRREIISIAILTAMYDTKQPTVKKVVDLFVYEAENQQQENVMTFLKKYVRCLQLPNLCKFLRFVTGTDTMCGYQIKIQFTNLSGLERRPIAHACGPVLDLPHTYRNYMELRTEFDNILNSNFHQMDFL